MKKDIEYNSPKKSTIDKILAFSKSISNVKTPKLRSTIIIHLN
ncbi:hypothetical protein SAMN05421738_11422 [Algoriella xinjiangensis]|uniref:Uncharacterized protein n=1 Tax=Algoriella xinjiangensis TaxID=684065 RepID=A0A1I4ZQC8_9FLAO|nr:hypothetical protein SAMN05421738_11422 [Algoriella xinjiangensis]VDH16306.1 Uncharacterised protein [Algoriella xinjiangensis]